MIRNGNHCIAAQGTFHANIGGALYHKWTLNLEENVDISDVEADSSYYCLLLPQLLASGLCVVPHNSIYALIESEWRQLGINGLLELPKLPGVIYDN
jgi:hypothetical protein